jgi:hypothetical protein
MQKSKGGDAAGWKRSHGVDQEDNSEYMRSYDPKADRKAYGDLNKIVGQRATVGSFPGGKQEVNSALEGDDA